MIGNVLAVIREYATAHPVWSLTYTFLGAIIVSVLTGEVQRHQRRITGFSGPTGLPVIGNLHQIRVNAAEQYRLWSKQYGPVYQISLGNVPVIVVNGAHAAREIFGNNAQALSSRPEFYTFHKIASSTAGTTIGTSPFSESLKRRRKGAASALNKPSVATYVSHIDLETRAFINEFMQYGQAGQNGVDPMPMIQRLSLSLALTLNWGTRMASQNDSLFREIIHVEDHLSRARSTTGNLQDYIPVLRWNPLSPGSAQAREMRSRRDVYLQQLNHDLDDRMEKGNAPACIQANVMQDKDAKLNREELRSISLTMLSGGLDTLTTLVAWSMILLAERPDIQVKALAEIRHVYSVDQILCDSDDDQSIRYIVALVRELLRYYTVLRLSLPRASVKDIDYHGHIIPAGSVVFLNAWACNMDPAVWGDDAIEFRPERWLEQPDAPLFTYGLGYRMCAGSLLANRELYTIYLRLISAFDIQWADVAQTVSSHPVAGVHDPTELVSVPHRCQVRLVPHDEASLQRALSEPHSQH